MPLGRVTRTSEQGRQLTPEDLRACIIYANGIDPRIQMNVPTAELWGRTVGHKLAIEVKTAILVYYERYPANGRENPPITAAMARKIISDEDARAEAMQSAQRALPPARNPSSYRSRNPKEWDRLVAAGRDDRRAELERRGIGLTQFQLDGDKPAAFNLPT